MIYRIENNDINASLNVTPNVNSQAYLRINGLYKAYGTGYTFIDFYTNTNNNIFICIKNNFADIYIDKNATITFDIEDIDELKNFILLKASEIITELPIDISHKNLEVGNIYSYTSPIFDRVSFIKNEISNDAKDCYNVAKKVFQNAINDKTYSVWYTDLSHRVRHNMSKLFTIKEIATATAYANEEGVVLISYLGTIDEYQKQGYAKFLLHHISKELNADKLVLQSKDEVTNKFYEKLGFTQDGKYYNYTLY